MNDIDKILNVARNEIGTKEVPSGSNKVKYNTEYYGSEVSGSGYAWCCAFVWWVFKHAGLSSIFYDGKKVAYCPYVENYYKSKNQWFSKGQKGDIVLFDFNGSKIAGHIGIVESVNADGSYVTIEGNTSVTSQDNGGAVMRRTRKASVIRGFARPSYSQQDEELTMEQYNELTKKIAYLNTIIDELNKSLTNVAKRLERLENKMVYNYIDDNMPEYARPTIQKMVDNGMLKGDENGLNLTDEMLRTFVMLDRANKLD